MARGCLSCFVLDARVLEYACNVSCDKKLISVQHSDALRRTLTDIRLCEGSRSYQTRLVLMTTVSILPLAAITRPAALTVTDAYAANLLDLLFKAARAAEYNATASSCMSPASFV